MDDVKLLKERLKRAGYSPGEIALIVDAHIAGGVDKAIETMRQIDATRPANPSPNTETEGRPRSLGYVATSSPAPPMPEGDDEVAKLRRKKRQNPALDLGLQWLMATSKDRRKKFPQTKV